MRHLNSLSALLWPLPLPPPPPPPPPSPPTPHPPKKETFTSIFHRTAIGEEDVSIKLSHQSRKFCNSPYAIERRCVDANRSISFCFNVFEALFMGIKICSQITKNKRNLKFSICCCMFRALSLSFLSVLVRIILDILKCRYTYFSSLLKSLQIVKTI